MPQRIWLLAIIYTLAMGLYIARLFQLQIVQGGHLDDAVQADRLIEELLPARRGRLLDRQGVTLVDNRPVYHLAVILREMELDLRQRRRFPHRELDETSLVDLVATISTHLGQDPSTVRQVVEQELQAHPGTAIRSIRRAQSLMGLVALPRQLTESYPDLVIRLGERRLISSRPGLALAQEIHQQWGTPGLVCPPQAFRQACHRLDQNLGMGQGYSERLLRAYASEVELTLPDASRQQWVLLDPQALSLGLDALSRASGRALDDIQQRLLQEVEADLTLDRDDPNWYLAPASRALELTAALPAGVVLEPVQLHGAPPGRERIYYLQDDPPGADDGMLSRFSRRLRASLGTTGDWLHALLLDQTEVVSALTIVRRYHPQHVVVFDHQKLDDFCRELARSLRAGGLDETALSVEARLTRARRRADRAWAGSTVLDAIPLLRNVDKRLAIACSPDAVDIPDDVATDFLATTPRLPGLRVQSELGREYRYPGLAPHLIGHMGKLARGIDRDEAEMRRLDPQGWRGTSGLEALYDTTLQGVTGKRLRLRTGSGVVLEQYDPPIPGQDLHLTLDVALQQGAEYALEHWYDLAVELGKEVGYPVATTRMENALPVNRGRASMVLMDVHSGEVLVMASRPSYRISDLRTRYQELIEHPDQPLIDHSCTASHPPGSTMKVAMGMLALASQQYSLGEEIHSRGRLGRMGDHAPAGDYDLARAIALSSNVIFGKLAERIGPEAIADWYRRFGCGGRLSPDVPWQRNGVCPDPANIAQLRPFEPFWTKGDTRRMGIGQFWPSSPLELIPIPAAVANGGTILAPLLVRLPDRGPQVVDRIQLSPAQWQEIRSGMKRTTGGEPHSTAPYLKLSGPAAGIHVAAKTGTSEWGNKDPKRFPDHAWLIGYAPADTPQVAFAIFVFGGTSGGRACSGIAKRVLEAYFERYR